MAQTAESIGANVFQFFTRNPRGGAAKPVDKADVAAFLDYAAEKGIGPILAHAPYTLNAAGAEPRVRDFAEEVMVDDLKRLELTPGAMYNFHPGSHVGQGAEKGIELIASHLRRVVGKVGAVSTTILLESFFGIPGLGSVAINAIHSSDMAVVRTVVVFGALLYQFVNLGTDILYAALDPRVRLS